MSPRSPWLLACAVAPLLLPLAASDARAASPEDQAAAETLFADARQLMQAGKVSEACRRFGESYRLDGTAGTLLNLALCHEKEGKIASAWAEYKASIIEARRTGRTDREQIAADGAANLAPQLPMLTVTVPAEAQIKGLHIERNGSVIEQGGWGTPLPVDPGEVKLDVSAPFYKPKSVAITVGVGEKKAIAIPALEIDEAQREAAQRANEPSFWTARRTWAAALGGVGLVGIGVGSYFGVAALGSKKDSQNDCPSVDGELRCSTQGAAESHTAVQQAWVSDIALGVGIAAVAGAVLLVVTEHRTDAPSDAPAPSSAKIDVAPYALAGARVRVTW